MNKLGIVLSVLLLAAGCAPTQPAPVVEQTLPAKEAPLLDTSPNPAPWVRASRDGSFVSRKEGGVQVLYKSETAQEGSRVRTAVEAPYFAAGNYEPEVVIAVSDNGQLAAYNTWDDTRKTTKLYVENIDGTGKRQVAEQQVPEGHGQILPYSIAFTPDGTALVYQELGGGELGGTTTTTYIVDLASTTTKVLAGTDQFGSVKSLTQATKKMPAKVTYAFSEMLGGDEANKAAAKDYGCGTKRAEPICLPDGTVSMPNGFYIRDLKKSASYALADTAVIELIPEDGGVYVRPATLDALTNLLKQDAQNKKTNPDYLGTPFRALVKDGQILLLTQVYIP